jgi:hypothetical protein
LDFFFHFLFYYFLIVFLRRPAFFCANQTLINWFLSFSPLFIFFIQNRFLLWKFNLKIQLFILFIRFGIPLILKLIKTFSFLSVWLRRFPFCEIQLFLDLNNLNSLLRQDHSINVDYINLIFNCIFQLLLNFYEPKRLV